jgi:16S rRNA (cytosine967-C5)-methyltransferase
VTLPSPNTKLRIKLASVQLTIEMLDEFFQCMAPFDIIMAKFFKRNKWVGASQRREIADFSYSIFRNYEAIKFYTSKITGNFGRFYVMTFLKAIDKLPNDEIAEIFSGKTYGMACAPSKMTNFEKRFLAAPFAEIPATARLNYPEWMDPYFKRAFPDDNFEDEMAALNEKAFVDLRVNVLKTSKDGVKQILTETGFKAIDSQYSANGVRILDGRISRSHRVISDGLAEIQDEGSQLVAEFCAVDQKSTIVDFCAGAGGKALAISAAMGNKGRIFALDKYAERLGKARIRFRRAGVSNVFCQEITGKWIKRHQECADVVLVDAPCSGTGTWRRNPDMRAKFSPKDLDELLDVQMKILESAQQLVKRGGRLIYATCSVLKEENDDQIEKFIKKFPEFEHKKVELKNLGMGEGEKYLRLSPYRNGTDGFFAACVEKKQLRCD